jgi:hypothetical protein
MAGSAHERQEVVDVALTPDPLRRDFLVVFGGCAVSAMPIPSSQC